MKTRRPWTEDDIEQLKRLSGTMSAREISIKMNRTISTIYTRANKNGIRLLRLLSDSINKETLQKLYNQENLTDYEFLSKSLNRKKLSIRNKIKFLKNEGELCI